MRALLLLPLLSACSLTLEVAYPGPRIQALRTQETYCADRNTRLDYRFDLEGRLDALEFFWVPEGVGPWRARPRRYSAFPAPSLAPRCGDTWRWPQAGRSGRCTWPLKGLGLSPSPTAGSGLGG
jgi:hypothetical protein